MASAKKCDRCGKLYEEYNTEKNNKKINGIMTLNLDFQRRYYSHTPFDLCPECKDSFEEWLGKKNDLRKSSDI